MNEICENCKKELKPALDCKNFVTGEWDEHTFLPFYECYPDIDKNLRLSVG